MSCACPGVHYAVRVVAKRVLRDFWELHPDSELPLKAWHEAVKDARWLCPAHVKARYLSASILRGNRVVFNICGNRYRLVVRIWYEAGIVYVRFLGTHAEYDDIDAQTI
jgi:mRNA interferase HigB